jgi:hypothetical protein
MSRLTDLLTSDTLKAVLCEQMNRIPAPPPDRIQSSWQKVAHTLSSDPTETTSSLK